MTEKKDHRFGKHSFGYIWNNDNMATKISNTDNGQTVNYEYDFSGKRTKKTDNSGIKTVYASSFYALF